MKKKNGFTLIELLAVIVILAVIALIAVPQILKILNKTRLSAAEDSTYGIIESAETYVSNFMLQNNGTLPSTELVFDCNGSSCDLQATNLIGYNLDDLKTLEFKGTKPKSGTIKISLNGSNIVAENLKINGFNCNYKNSIATCTQNDDSGNTPVVQGPTSEIPSGDGYTGVKAIVYLDPIGLTKHCDASNVKSETGTIEGCMKWYAYADDGENYTMILDHNTTAVVAWNSSINNSSMDEVATALSSDTIGWDSDLNPRLITADEVAQITGNESFNQYTSLESSWFYFDTLDQTIPTERNYGWLYDRTRSDCKTTYGCLNNAVGAIDTYGYWTSTPIVGGSTYAWFVSRHGILDRGYVSDATYRGVRPVITVPKNKIS